MQHGSGRNKPTKKASVSARSDERHGVADRANSVWLRPRRAVPRRTAPLSRERIVTAAVALLDHDGAGRLTMRRLAERLEAGPTTLYWHVDTKDDVLDLAVDAVFGEVALPALPTSGSWRESLSTFLHQWRSVLLDHPWSAPLLGTRPLLGPNALARSEFLHTTLLTAGIPQEQVTAAAHGLSNYVIGSATTRAAWHSQGDETATRRAAHEHLHAHRDSYPVQAEHRTMTDQDWDTSFTRGLTYLLDGLETHIQHDAADTTSSDAGDHNQAPT